MTITTRDLAKLSVNERFLIVRYLTAAEENQYATLKRVPLNLIEPLQQAFKAMGKPIRVRYRGQRRNPYHTLKRDATHASIYPRVVYDYRRGY